MQAAAEYKPCLVIWTWFAKNHGTKIKPGSEIVVAVPQPPPKQGAAAAKGTLGSGSECPPTATDLGAAPHPTNDFLSNPSPCALPTPCFVGQGLFGVSSSLEGDSDTKSVGLDQECLQRAHEWEILKCHRELAASRRWCYEETSGYLTGSQTSNSSLCTSTARRNQRITSFPLKDSLLQKCHSFLTQPGKSGCLAKWERVSISSWGVQQCRRIWQPPGWVLYLPTPRCWQCYERASKHSSARVLGHCSWQEAGTGAEFFVEFDSCRFLRACLTRGGRAWKTFCKNVKDQLIIVSKEPGLPKICVFKEILSWLKWKSFFAGL